MEKKKHRSLEEILDSLKSAEKEFDEKLDKYGMKEVKPQKSEDEDTQEPSINEANVEGSSEIVQETPKEEN